MKIWIDADACPRAIKDVICRAAERVQCEALFVANQSLSMPPGRFTRSIQVEKGFDVADNYLLQHAEAGDIAITSDIPLAAELLKKGVAILTSRGESLNDNNIRQRLSMRNFMEELRSSGEQHGGPPPLSLADRQKFANALDRWLAKKR